MRYLDCFYLDREKDIVVKIYTEDGNCFYVLETPNHKTGNLITNLARILGEEIAYNEQGLKIITGSIPCFIAADGQEIHILRMGGVKIANIYSDGQIFVKAMIPAISKTLMSQSKDCDLDIRKTLVKAYIPKQCKFRTDLHTHMNANLHPDVLIALGITRQIRYPYYYVKKLGLKLSDRQIRKLEIQRKKTEKLFADSELKGRYLDRRIDDNTFINFADLILNNLADAADNIVKIRASLTILKDGQAVFTNLEKVYLYRYVFTKGVESENKIALHHMDEVPDKDIRAYMKQMLADHRTEEYRSNTIFQDKLLWIGRCYAQQGIRYVEISDTTLVKKEEAVGMLEQVHYICPLIENETGVRIRFLAALRRIPLTIIKDVKTPANYLRDNLDVLKAVALDPYVVGSDIVGEEINDITELKPVISELVGIARNDPDFTIRIHAGENDALKDNVYAAIQCVKSSLAEGQAFPKMRIGHGLHTAGLDTAKGRQMLNAVKKNNVVLEFQITSNVRLNNLNSLDAHPLRQYLEQGIRCVQGSDGFGTYGVNSFDEQLALITMLNLSNEEMLLMKETEDEIVSESLRSFKRKIKAYSQFLNGRSLARGLREEIEYNQEHGYEISLTLTSKTDAKKEFAAKISEMPEDRIPVIIGGGSFNTAKRETKVSEEEKRLILDLLKRLDPQKYFFVIGNKLEGHEKYLVQQNRGRFQIFAIVPALVSEAERDKLKKAKVSIRVSTENLGMGIYKSFNYEIFERRPSVVIALDGNSAGANLVQEARNGKGKADIYVSSSCKMLRDKARQLKGYVKLFTPGDDIVSEIVASR